MSRAVTWRSNVFCDCGSPNDDVMLHWPRLLAFLLSDGIIDVKEFLLPHCEQITVLTYWLQAKSFTPSPLCLCCHGTTAARPVCLCCCFLYSFWADPFWFTPEHFSQSVLIRDQFLLLFHTLFAHPLPFAWYNTQLWDNFPVCEYPTTNQNTCCYSVRASIAIFSPSFPCVCVCVHFFFFSG